MQWKFRLNFIPRWNLNFLKNSSPTGGDLTNNFSRNVEIIVLLGNSYWFAPQSRLYSGDQVETLRMRTSFCLFLSELEGRFSPLQLFIDPAMALGWLGGSRSCQKFQNFSIRSQILCLLMTFLINSLKYFEFSALFSFQFYFTGKLSNWIKFWFVCCRAEWSGRFQFEPRPGCFSSLQRRRLWTFFFLKMNWMDAETIGERLVTSCKDQSISARMYFVRSRSRCSPDDINELNKATKKCSYQPPLECRPFFLCGPTQSWSLPFIYFEHFIFVMYRRIKDAKQKFKENF